MKEVLTVNVELKEIHEVRGARDVIRMITFTGYSDCDCFKGKILSGGVDTQKELAGELPFLSARYMLEGQDYKGQPCRIFIENNGQAVQEPDEMITSPSIVTDSEALSFLENLELKGTIEPWEKGVIIHIFACRE